MCGITGFLTQNWKPESGTTIQRMTDSIEHRGPDAEGIFTDSNAGIAIGHRRLSVIDLSDSGSQPMRSHCGRYVIAYNGELYNNSELREFINSDPGSSIPWRGHSDTETILALVSIYGINEAILKINGMFAISIWDLKNRTLHLVRDRFGEKPLYYGVCNNAVVFGSELRSVVMYPDISDELDSVAVAQMIRYSAVPSPRSIYKNIFKVQPAHHIVFNLSAEEISNECYWDVFEGAKKIPDYDHDSAVAHLNEILPSIVNSRMASDVPLGAFLSGGIDSSLVVALMQLNSSVPINTFTMGFEFETHNEAPFAKKVSEHLGTKHTELYVSGKDALDVVVEIPRLYDEPFADSSQIPTVLVSRLAREHVTVCLTGDGGDELFGGYRRYQKADAIWNRMDKIPKILRNRFNPDVPLSMLPLVNSKLLRKTPYLGKKMGYLEDLIELVAAQSFDQFYDGFLAQRTGTMTVVPSVNVRDTQVSVNHSPDHARQQRMLNRDLATYLHDVVLAKVDRASMSCSLETRAPLLDPKLAEFAVSLPWNIKNYKGTGKWPLTAVLEQHVPKELFDRPKMGFGVPFGSWLRGPLRDWAEDLLSESSLSQTGLINVQGVRELWWQHSSGQNDRHYPLWNILMFQAWLREHDWS